MKMMFEGAEMAEEDEVVEWATRTGTSDIRVKWTLDKPTQKFWLWKPSGTIGLGSEELEGRTREEVWRSLQLRNPEMREFEDYRLFEKQREVNWTDLPIADLTAVPKVIPVVERGRELQLVNHTTLPRPRNVGRLTPMAFEIFTMEKSTFYGPVVIHAPNEISLAQLVTYFILPEKSDFDVSTDFYWCLEEVEDKSVKDKTKKTLVQIAHKIPPGFVLRVKASTLHDNSSKGMVRCKYGSVPMCFAMPENSAVGRLAERVRDWMSQRGLPDDWTLGRPDDKAKDFEYEYPVTVPDREQPIKLFLKQKEVEVAPSESWINASDKLVRAYHLPLGTLFRIYPVIGMVDNQDSEDDSYDITWEAGKQYWFDIIYDEGKDRRGTARKIRMVDHGGRVESFVVPVAATAQNYGETYWKLQQELEWWLDRGTTVNTSGGTEQHKKPSLTLFEPQTFTESRVFSQAQINSRQIRSAVHLISKSHRSHKARSHKDKGEEQSFHSIERWFH
jgi:hypothetical protein